MFCYLNVFNILNISNKVDQAFFFRLIETLHPYVTSIEIRKPNSSHLVLYCPKIRLDLFSEFVRLLGELSCG